MNKGSWREKMSIQSGANRKSVKLKRKMRALVLAVGCTISLNSQAIVFFDPTNFVENFLQEIQSYAQFAKDNSHYLKEIQYFADQAQRWKQQYDAAMALIDLSTYQSLLPGGVKLVKVDEDFMVRERCGGEAPSIFSVSGLKEIVLSKIQETLKTEDLDKQQKKTCAFIQMLKNKRYNDSIDFLETTMPAFQRELDIIARSNIGNRTPGQMAQAMYKLKVLSNTMDIQMATWNSRNQAYESYIVLMEDKQKSLAKQALNGKEVLLGTVVKNLALRAALENERTQ
ncbi:hypothetical protein [Xanthomonas campestris]|uniref:hypothetical protein n=2 Tax=Xanthomonas campestris TaxID=339 RepID=UPI002B23E806|nr:hypothetical protein [Xanthomonas campestris]